MGIEECACWDELWVLYRNQFDNKFHIKKIKESELVIGLLGTINETMYEKYLDPDRCPTKGSQHL